MEKTGKAGSANTTTPDSSSTASSSTEKWKEIASRLLRFRSVPPDEFAMWKTEYIVTGLINACNSKGETYLTSAVRNKDFRGVCLAIAASAKINQPDQTGSTPLHIAASQLRGEMVPALLERGAHTHVVDLQGRTPLHMAIEAGRRHTEADRLDTEADRLNTIKLLIDGGADVNAFDASGKFMHAQFEKSGIDMEGIIRPDLAPLHYAVRMSDTAVMELLLSRGAKVNASDPRSGVTAVICAAMWSTRRVARLLINWGANIHTTDSYGNTALHVAAECGNTQVAELLLNLGANLEKQDHKKQTPLHFASRYKITEVAQLLIYSGADVNAADSTERTPLHWATMYNNVAVAQLLINHEADFNAVDGHGGTALHLAAECGSIKLVELLVELGANLEAKDKKGNTPLHEAATTYADLPNNDLLTGQKARIIDILRHAGASVSSTNLEGKTPLGVAQTCPRPEKRIIQALKERI